MSRIIAKWRSWSARRRALAAGLAILVAAAAGVFAYEKLKRPPDVTNDDVRFVETPKEPKPYKIKQPRTVNWKTYGYTNARTRYFPTGDVHPPFGTSDWSFQGGKLFEFPPVLVKNRLYIADIDGLLYSLKGGNGKVEWTQKIGTRGASSAAYSDGKLYTVALAPGQATALRAKDGKILWQKSLPGRSESSPLVYKNRLVIFGCECGTVFALDTKDGDIEWQVQTGGAVKAALALSGGNVYGGNYAGEAFSIDASSGREEWRTDTIGGSFGRGGGIYSTPAVAFGRVYFGSIDSRIYSLDEKTGAIAWSRSTGAEVYSSPAVADTPGTPPSVYIGSLDDNVYALDAKDGSVRWQKNLGGDITGSVTVIGQTAYAAVIGQDKGSFGLSVKDGEQQFSNEIGEYTNAITDGRRLYLIGYSNVRAFPPKDLVKERAKARRIRRRQKNTDRETARESGATASPTEDPATDSESQKKKQPNQKRKGS
jgi:outer membrane protein assembly factor BamB